MSVHTYCELSTHPHVHTHKYRVYTDMYRYLQVSPLKFKTALSLEIQSALFSHLNSCVFNSADLPPLFYLLIWIYISF